MLFRAADAPGWDQYQWLVPGQVYNTHRHGWPMLGTREPGDQGSRAPNGDVAAFDALWP